MSFNQVAKYLRGYLESVGNQGGIIAGLTGLSIKGSTKIAGICCDYSGNIYVTDYEEHIVLKITESGVITVIAGVSGQAGNNGNNTVTATEARFRRPVGITCAKNGDLYVADSGNNQIRRISNNKVSLVAGNIDGSSGTDNGVGSNAQFNRPHGIAIDNSGIIYVADKNNHSVRKINGGVVTTLAGLNGTSGDYPEWTDMTTAQGVLGANARFDTPFDVCVNANGYVFVMDSGNHVIKRIDPAGNVRVFSGSGVDGTSLGTSPYFSRTCEYRDLRFCDVTKSEEIYLIDYEENMPARLLTVNREGRPFVVVDFDNLNGSSTSSEGYWGEYVSAVVCNPAGHIIVAESIFVTDKYYSSSSSSSSSTEAMSTSSESSSSESSLSSNPV